MRKKFHRKSTFFNFDDNFFSETAEEKCANFGNGKIISRIFWENSGRKNFGKKFREKISRKKFREFFFSETAEERSATFGYGHTQTHTQTKKGPAGGWTPWRLSLHIHVLYNYVSVCFCFVCEWKKKKRKHHRKFRVSKIENHYGIEYLNT